VSKTNAQLCKERPINYWPTAKRWFLLTNYGIAWGVFPHRSMAIRYANNTINGEYNDKTLPDSCEIRRVVVSKP
jgi:hypothetical protein